jgi:hypothetical protein
VPQERGDTRSPAASCGSDARGERCCREGADQRGEKSASSARAWLAVNTGALAPAELGGEARGDSYAELNEAGTPVVTGGAIAAAAAAAGLDGAEDAGLDVGAVDVRYVPGDAPRAAELA